MIAVSPNVIALISEVKKSATVANCVNEPKKLPRVPCRTTRSNR